MTTSDRLNSAFVILETQLGENNPIVVAAKDCKQQENGQIFQQIELLRKIIEITEGSINEDFFREYPASSKRKAIEGFITAYCQEIVTNTLQQQSNTEGRTRLLTSLRELAIGFNRKLLELDTRIVVSSMRSAYEGVANALQDEATDLPKYDFPVSDFLDENKLKEAVEISAFRGITNFCIGMLGTAHTGEFAAQISQFVNVCDRYVEMNLEIRHPSGIPMTTQTTMQDIMRAFEAAVRGQSR